MLKKLRMFALALPFLMVFAVSGAHASNDMIIEKASPLSFDDTVTRVKQNAKALGWKVPKSWKHDFQKNLKKVTKEDIGKNIVFSMCEPYAAVKLLKHDKYKKFLSMMPCSFAVYEQSDGKVYVSFMNIQMMGQMYKGEAGIEELVNELGPHMVKMVNFD